MKEYKYAGFEHPIIQNDDGTLTYRGHVITKFHSNKPTPSHLIAQHYVDEMIYIDRIIKEEKQPEKERRYEDTADYAFDKFWREVEGEKVEW